MVYKEYRCMDCGELHESDYKSYECPYCDSSNIRLERNYSPFD